MKIINPKVWRVILNWSKKTLTELTGDEDLDFDNFRNASDELVATLYEKCELISIDAERCLALLIGRKLVEIKKERSKLTFCDKRIIKLYIRVFLY